MQSHLLFFFSNLSCNLKKRTALHWAAKRNQLDVAHCLLTNGANKDLESFAKEIPADLSTSPAVLNLLGSPKLRNKAEETEGSIIPHYLAHPASGHKVEVQEQFNSPTVFLKREIVEPKGKKNMFALL